MTKKAQNLIILCIIVVLTALLLIFGKSLFFAAPSESEEPTSSVDSLVVSEVVTASRTSLVTENGAAPDWIELYNGSSSAISLGGLTLTDDPKLPDKFAFPSVRIGAGEYLLILCDNSEAEDDFIHANFRLSSDGDYIGIFSGTTEVFSLEIPALGKDLSYALAADDSYQYCGVPTPGAANSAVCAADVSLSTLANTLSSETLVINEYQVNNRNTIMDADSEHYPWVELKNVGAEAISLADYALSDSTMSLGKWNFPDQSLAPGETLLIFLSGKDATGHADFTLGSTDTCITLTKNGYGLVDLVAVDPATPADCSYGRTADGSWAYFPSPTPNRENTTKSFSRIDISEENYLPS